LEQTEGTEFIITLEFENPIEVSASTLDSYYLVLNDPSLFISSVGLLPLERSRVISNCRVRGQDACQQIPPYIDPGTKSSLETTSTIYSSSINTLTASNLLVMIFFGGTLQHLWSVIRPLQHLAILGLANVVYPGNLYQFFIGMVEIANLDILFGYQITTFLFTMRESEPFNDLFEAFGIDTKNFLLNTGSMIIPIIPILLAHFAFYHTLKYLGKKYY